MVQRTKIILKNSVKSICKPSTKIKSLPTERGLLETECLYGEKVKIFQVEGNWAKCITLLDNYEGWVKTSDLFQLEETTHRVTCARSFVFSEPNIKSCIVDYLPMGSKLNIFPYDDNWSEIKFFKDNNYIKGFVITKHITPKGCITNDWVFFAEQLIGVPYKWGGRDTIGIDCSALIQLSLETIGVDFPRNSKDQEKFNSGLPFDYNLLSRGSLIYWNGHVGVMINKNELLHANAYHMMVVSEELDTAIDRIKKKYGPVKKIVNNYLKFIS